MKPQETIHIAGGIYFRSVRLKKDTIIPQHTHDHDHATYVGSGSAQLFINGELAGEYSSGDAIEMKKGQVHAFRSLEDNTLLVCVWPESIGETFPEDQ